jgi:N-acetylmuramoyl-L-alanine amidase
MKIINPLMEHFRTPEDFHAYLANLVAPRWFKKVTVHHTVIPTVNQWRGKASMEGMLAYYRGLGWKRFPHIFIAPDGIWQMNNVLAKGIHANAANSFSIGVEVVGNYDSIQWQEPIFSYAIEGITSLQLWGKLQTSDIVLHRTYNNEKTCPGTAISYDWIVNNLEAFRRESRRTKYRVLFDKSRIRQGPSTRYPISGMLHAGDTFISHALKTDESQETINGETTWAHVTQAINTRSEVDQLGFVHRSLLEIIE